MKPVRLKPKKKSSTKRPDTQKVRQPKRWLLLSFIYLLMFINGMMVLLSFLAYIYVEKKQPGSSTLFRPEFYVFSLAIALANLFCLNALLHEKLWGFWGFCLTTTAMVIFNIVTHTTSGKPIASAFLGFGAPLLLFGLLYMGGRRSAWYEMKNKKQKTISPSSK